MSTATLRSGVDAFVGAYKPTANYVEAITLRAQNPGSTTVYSYLYFKNPAPKGATILSATLHLAEWAAFSAGAKTVSVQRVSAAWGASKITYNNRPGVTGTIVSVTAVGAAADQDWAFDVTALMQTMTDSGVNYGFRISTSSTSLLYFGSFQSTTRKPTLVVEWTLAPEPPVELAPSAGATVTLSKPVLQFNFHDIAGSTAMASCQVQINPTNSFTAPAFDSGEVATSDPELDLSTTAYAGLAAGATAWWRVRVKDDAGLWSDWSDSTSFKRGSRGALVINSPTVSIDDPTQEIIWTLTGAVQTAWRVKIADDSNPTVLLLDTGKKSGTDNSYTIPKGVITTEGTIYRITIWTWDDLSKTATPNDPIQTEAVVAVPFNSAGTGDVITGLAANPRPSRQPGMYIEWDRPNAPDSYEVRRSSLGGPFVVVDTDLDPADLIVSGTHYRYLDREASPITVHSWRVLSKTSSGVQYGPIVTDSYTVDTVWIEDVASGHLVPLIYRSAGDGLGAITAPQISSVLQTVSGDRVVRTVQGQAGMQGSVSGVIIDSYGQTAVNWVANLRWLQARPWLKLRLTIGNRNLYVAIGDIVIAPYTGGGPETGGSDAAASFNWWEQ